MEKYKKQKNVIFRLLALVAVVPIRMSGVAICGDGKACGYGKGRGHLRSRWFSFSFFSFLSLSTKSAQKLLHTAGRKKRKWFATSGPLLN